MGKELRITSQALRVLAVLVEAGQELSGFELSKKTGLQTGTVYPLLFRLEEAGWLQSRWESKMPSDLGRPRRRYYSITALGALNARREVGLYQSLRGMSVA